MDGWKREKPRQKLFHARRVNLEVNKVKVNNVEVNNLEINLQMNSEIFKR